MIEEDPTEINWQDFLTGLKGKEKNAFEVIQKI